MFQHFLAVGAALVVGLWSTVVQQYHEFRAPDSVATTEVAEVPSVPLATPPTPTTIETVANDIVNNTGPTPPSTTTIQVSPTVVPGPVAPTAPSVPFTPLPVPITPVIVSPEPVTPPSEPVVPIIDEQLLDEALLRSAVVNVICIQGGGLRGSSGSGVVIDPRGIIVTVAHVGQNFLLRDYPEDDTGSCYIRTGSPAKNAYSAELVYVSPSWLEENELTFLKTKPTGTGEHDFAFLVITGSLTGASLPSRFAHIPLAPAETDIDKGDEVGTGSYAAEFLTSSQIRSSLYPTIKFAEVDDVFTFGRNTIDIFSVAAGSAAQEGSSGGVVMNEEDRLIGLITTRTSKTDLSLRTLQAITTDHMRRSFRADTGENLDAYLRNDIVQLVQNFAETAEELEDNLFEAIEEAQN